MSDRVDRIDPDKRPDERIDRGLLEAFAVPEPAPDLADRFFARLRDGAPASRRRRWRIAIAALSVGAAVALLVTLSRGKPEPAAGALTAVERTTIAIAGRAVAVAEPGTTLAWNATAGGAVRLEQAVGDVFYRVDAGAAFVVATRAGEVSVRGTCFRVDVPPADDAGAPVTVHVHEGIVVLASAHGRLEVSAGQSGQLAPGKPPGVADRARVAAPPSSPPVAEIIARDAAQRKRIASLEAQLAAHDEPFRGIGGTEAHNVRRAADMSRDQLEAMAGTCDLPFDLVPLAGSTIMDKVIEEGAVELQLSASERAAVDAAVRDFQPGHETSLRALYRELTGQDGEALDALTLAMEILQKSTAADIAAAKKTIAAERAGLREPPADRNAGAVVERYLRFAVAAPDEFERALARAIGAARARVFRRTWAAVDMGPGCPRE